MRLFEFKFELETEKEIGFKRRILLLNKKSNYLINYKTTIMKLQNLQVRKLTFQEEKETEGGCDPQMEAILRAIRAIRSKRFRPIYGFRLSF